MFTVTTTKFRETPIIIPKTNIVYILEVISIGQQLLKASFCQFAS